MIKYEIKRKIVNCEKMESVTSHDLYPLSHCHKLSHFLRPPPPLERDILYGRPLAGFYSYSLQSNSNVGKGIYI